MRLVILVPAISLPLPDPTVLALLTSLLFTLALELWRKGAKTIIVGDKHEAQVH
jgi:hypothetical protein